jgi:hypothetical protein
MARHVLSEPGEEGGWLGHRSVAMVEKVHSHLGVQRHRSAAAEYRVEQHAASSGSRLEAVRGVGT